MLEVNQLSKKFGGLVAVNGLNLKIEKCETIGLIGPNGAGKSTVFNLLTGFLRPTGGGVLFEGKDITGKKPHRIARRGISRTFQTSAFFPDFSILQNLVVACHSNPKIGFLEAALHIPGSSKKQGVVIRRALKLVEFLGLAAMKDDLAKNLSHGHQRLLGIAIALCNKPKLLLLDEPLAGMSLSEVRETVALLGKLKSSGITILLVEHNMTAVMELCDNIVVLNFGRKIAEGPPEEIRGNKKVIEAYLGVNDVA